jgi:4-amino-4-deoxy-L-arabinose transferase-like glycosyltransferase
MGRAAQLIRRHPWGVAFGVVMVVIAVLKLSALGTAPPGLYNDEASIGYNAWAIAHHGADEHGVPHPLYFEAFGEYKNPVYVYMLAPLTWVLPLTPWVVRLPAALCGIVLCAVVALTVWRLTRSRAGAMAALITAGVTPWLTEQSRVGFEVITFTTLLGVAIWCFVRSCEPDSAEDWRWGAGTALGACVFAYSTGRAYVLALVLLMVVIDRHWRRLPQMLPVLIPVALAYLVLAIYAHYGPDGALSSRYNIIGITADSPGNLVIVERFVRNYFTYLGVPFLFTNGDSNLRHNTGYGGMLLITTAPALVLGLVSCARRWREPVPRFLLAGLALAPATAAVTWDGTPHALRSTAMLPFLLVLIGIGWAEILPAVQPRRLLLAAVVMAVCIDAGGYMWDLYVRWPGRSLAWFDTGELSAVHQARLAANGHHIWLSERLDAIYIQALFDATPPPSPGHLPVSSAAELASMGATAVPDGQAARRQAAPGDIVVLGADESPPDGATLIDEESVTVAPDAATLSTATPDVRVLARVYRV